MKTIEFTITCPHCGGCDNIIKKNGYFRMQKADEVRQGRGYACGGCGTEFAAEIKLASASKS